MLFDKMDETGDAPIERNIRTARRIATTELVHRKEAMKELEERHNIFQAVNSRIKKLNYKFYILNYCKGKNRNND